MVRIPGSTYRIQLHKGFTFDDAAAIAEYLKTLGITHVYSSPYLQAAPNSMHGYDVVDHRRVNEELGGAEAHERFSKKLGETGLGQILDIVPNHMSLGEQNRYWWDVLENGSSSRYAGFFDIDWNSAEKRLRDKVLVPILGDQYGRVLKAGDIKVARKDQRFTIEVAGQSLPAAPQSLALILNRAADSSRNDTLSFLAASYSKLPSPEPTDRRTVLARHRDKVVLDSMLARACAEDEFACAAIDRSVGDLNANIDALDEFLNQQNFRLSYWKTADQQLGYRRFFDVNTLIGLRVSREYVFEETHALILRWLEQGVLDGVRVDHPDGLRDPLQYFQRLRQRAPNAYIVGEKILGRGEFMRSNWPIQGTSGYDFLNMVSGLYVMPAGMTRLTKSYESFTSEPVDYAAIAHDKKLNVEQEALGSDVNRLTNLFVDICECNREYRDFTRAEVRRAIREVAACFGVYRTYVSPEREEITDEDRQLVEHATRCAGQNRSDIDAALFDFMRDVLCLVVRGKKETEFVYRFQQFTSPVMAKGVEDTAFYCFNRLTGLNEVGGDPGRDGVTLEEFHSYNERIQREFPETMLTLSTHDTKRSDDVRARLAVLSEMPREFATKLKGWSRANATYRSGKFPDRGTEWFLYQTMIGAWPIDADRMKQYMQKAMREAKAHTSWTSNNAEYESAFESYIDSILGDEEFLADFTSFVATLLYPGRVNSLSQTLLKYTSPGMPDIYQGGELWDLSLVDPDNRRPVDYKLRRRLLGEAQTLDAAAVLSRMDEGLPKLWLVHRCLELRNQHPDWFGRAAVYVPLHATGPDANHIVAFLRGEHVIAVTQRWTTHLDGTWEDTTLTLPEGAWNDRLSGQTFQGGDVELRTLLAQFPAALLVRGN